MKTYTEDKKIFQIHARVSKNESSFLYFTLEANENVAFYSTIPFEKGQAYRDIVINCTPELKTHLLGVLDHLQKKIKIEVLKEELIDDL